MRWTLVIKELTKTHLEFKNKILRQKFLTQYVIFAIIANRKGYLDSYKFSKKRFKCYFYNLVDKSLTASRAVQQKTISYSENAILQEIMEIFRAATIIGFCKEHLQ